MAENLKETPVDFEARMALLEHVLDALPQGVIVVSGEGQIEEVNRVARDLLGYKKQALEGSPVSVLFADERSDFNDSPGELLNLKEEQVFKSAQGATLPVSFKTAVVVKEGKSQQAVVCMISDLRESMKAKSEASQAQKLESVGQLAAGIAHEINTPMQFIGDNVYFLRESFDDLSKLIFEYQQMKDAAKKGTVEDVHLSKVLEAEVVADLEYLAENVPKAFVRTQDGIGRVTSIVRAMKEFSHPDQKEKEPCDLNRAIQTTLTIARNEYKYVSDAETELGELPSVMCYSGDLNQVLLNLIINAADAIEEVIEKGKDRGTITLKTAVDGDHVVISVSDTGAGIPPEVKDRIFDPFFTTKEVGKGTGQGLALAWTVVVDKHGGTLSCESEVGSGTTFFIRLPIDGGGVGVGSGAEVSG